MINRNLHLDVLAPQKERNFPCASSPPFAADTEELTAFASTSTSMSLLVGTTLSCFLILVCDNSTPLLNGVQGRSKVRISKMSRSRILNPIGAAPGTFELFEITSRNNTLKSFERTVVSWDRGVETQFWGRTSRGVRTSEIPRSTTLLIFLSTSIRPPPSLFLSCINF